MRPPRYIWYIRQEGGNVSLDREGNIWYLTSNIRIYVALHITQGQNTEKELHRTKNRISQGLQLREDQPERMFSQWKHWVIWTGWDQSYENISHEGNQTAIVSKGSREDKEKTRSGSKEIICDFSKKVKDRTISIMGLEKRKHTKGIWSDRPKRNHLWVAGWGWLKEYFFREKRWGNVWTEQGSSQMTMMMCLVEAGIIEKSQ